MPAISFNQHLEVAPDTLINKIGEESVLLNLNSEKYFGLDEMGTCMWVGVEGWSLASASQ